MGLAQLQEKLRGVLAAAETEEDPTKFEALVVEGHSLKAQIEKTREMDEIKQWAGKSAGMLPVAGAQSNGVTVHQMTKSGEVVIERREGAKALIPNLAGLLGERAAKSLRDPDYDDAFWTAIRYGKERVKSANGLKVLNESIDDEGGYLAPEEIQNRVIVKDPAPTVVASRVQRFTTSRDSVVVPRVVYTANNKYTTGMRVTWGAENPSATSHRVTEPVFGQFRVEIYTAMMSIPLSNNLLQDAAFDVQQFVSNKFSETIDLLREDMIINGSGSGQPRGILANPDATNEPAHVHSGVADALSWAGLQNLCWAVPDQYDANCAFVFNKTSTGLAIAKMVDGDGRPLWSQGVGDSGLVGSPKQRQLLGYPVLYSAFMPDIAADAEPIIFGDLSGYVMVDRSGFQLQVLRETYAEQNQVVLLGKIRFGGGVAEDWKLKVQTVAA